MHRGEQPGPFTIVVAHMCMKRARRITKRNLQKFDKINSATRVHWAEQPVPFTIVVAHRFREAGPQDY